MEIALASFFPALPLILSFPCGWWVGVRGLSAAKIAERRDEGAPLMRTTNRCDNEGIGAVQDVVNPNPRANTIIPGCITPIARLWLRSAAPCQERFACSAWPSANS